MHPPAEIYVSTDIETDGPIPGPHSMLALGSAAYCLAGSPPEVWQLSTFHTNLVELPGAAGHPKALAWWRRHPRLWEDCRRTPVEPDTAMPLYAEWVESLPALLESALPASQPRPAAAPIFVAYPLAHDFMFVQWYLVRFTSGSPFDHHGIDIRTYAMATLRQTYCASSKRHLPRRWRSAQPHTHDPLAGAIEQGELFMNMLRENQKQA